MKSIKTTSHFLYRMGKWYNNLAGCWCMALTYWHYWQLEIYSSILFVIPWQKILLPCYCYGNLVSLMSWVWILMNLIHYCLFQICTIGNVQPTFVNKNTILFELITRAISIWILLQFFLHLKAGFILALGLSTFVLNSN